MADMLTHFQSALRLAKTRLATLRENTCRFSLVVMPANLMKAESWRVLSYQSRGDSEIKKATMENSTSI